jgi:hypothetical protein
MFPKQLLRILPLFLLTGVLALSGCDALIRPVTTSGTAPTPVVSFDTAVVDNPDVFVDPPAFHGALLQALAAHNTQKLQMWMIEPFLIGTWRSDLSDSSSDEALRALYTEQLGPQKSLTLVKDADLKALMGGKDPLSIPRSEAGVIDAFLVSNWGIDGRDEAILFIARQANNSLKWQGWMQVKGGFSGTRLGGIKPYKNDALGFSVYFPQDYEVPKTNPTEVMFLAPGTGHPDEHRAAAFIMIEDSNGRTAEQIANQTAEQAKADLGAGYTGGIITAMSIDGEPAYSVNMLPGQDFNRQLFIVHGSRLYKMMFVPDNPNAPAYQQMEDIYAMIVNTFHFIK